MPTREEREWALADILECIRYNQYPPSLMIDIDDLGDCVPVPREELDRLELFARLAAFAIEEARRDGGGDVDGGAIQDEMVRLGILHTVTVDEPCGDECVCAEYGDFPQECLRLTPAAHEFAGRMKKG